LEKGTGIKIRKHLRGVTDFEMFGQNFKIISPYKEGNRSLELYENRAKPLIFAENQKLSACA
jgi:hypothetical protein